ncbi:unnamed protein product [Didymodactylos carnosus]|uniref:Glycoside hydrolase family 65 central catalytic domain-containing protein n=1 Tax=Didymodactylos carnosus TaxID=1234261 RepID=A0A8S2DGA2_9BILA|nr:unnamed protein product [Didymodactylos carnosus]CAF3708128.1 unnamed protein product [Didymodactylos carnosus]
MSTSEGSEGAYQKLGPEQRVFIEYLEDSQVIVERKIFAYQEYTELIISHITVKRVQSTLLGSINIPVVIHEEKESDDFIFNVANTKDYTFFDGTTKQVENNQFQSEKLKVYIYYTPLPVDGLELNENETTKTFVFVTSMDTSNQTAKKSFDYATTLINENRFDYFYETQVQLWNQIWSNGRIDIEGDEDLQRQINSAYYYLLSSLPALHTKSDKKQFYGLSPGSLSRGGKLGEDYGGHSFWDTETWMYPAILMFYPTLAKDILSYRIALKDSAIDNAIIFNYTGWRFPWESARTGVDVTPECCPEDAQPFKNNSVYTNAIASLSIDLANRVSCITNKIVPSQWLDVANNLYFPFDSQLQIYLEYEHFNIQTAKIKQADVVLLDFPLMWPMNETVRRNNLLMYENITRDDGPAMTWSMHAVGFLELNDIAKAEHLFRRSYQTYVRPPFNVWTEARSGVGAVNFITGAGGFLQSVLFGYGGIRLRFEQLEFFPTLPPGTNTFTFYGLKYLGSTFDVKMDSKQYELSVIEMNNQNIELSYDYGGQQGKLKGINDRISVPIKTRLTIRSIDTICKETTNKAITTRIQNLLMQLTMFCIYLFRH